MNNEIHCHFYQLEAGKVKCANCGRIVDTPHQPEKCHAICDTFKDVAFPEENKRLCEWQAVVGQTKTDTPYHRCIHCGHVAKFQLAIPLYRECPVPHTGRQVVKMPPFLERMKNFAESLAEHLAKGMPQSTQEEVLESFRVCSSCKFYNDLVGACGSCGCIINLYLATENLNALAWASKRCPENKWKSPLERREENEN